MSAVALEEATEEWFLRFPERYYKHPKLRLVRRAGFPETTDWLFPILIEAKASRSAGALMVMGEPVTPQNVGDLIDVCTDEPISEAWVLKMVEHGLFSLCPETGAIIVECRRYFYRYKSDSPEAQRERQAACRERKRQDGHEFVTSRHDTVTSVTNLSRAVTNGHEESRTVTAVTTEYRSDQIQEKSDHSIHLSSGDRAIERSSDSPVSELDSFRLQHVAQKAYEGFKPRPSKRFFALCQDFHSKYAGVYGSEVACLALQHAGQATAWAQRHGPKGVSESSINSYAMQCAKNQLAPIADRENDRAFAKEQGLPDPGPLLWIPPDEEAMLA